MSECLALVVTPRRRRVCGAKAVGYIAPGIGRCVYHLSMHSRETRAAAARKAVREMYELRGVNPDEDACRNDDNARGGKSTEVSVDSDGTIWTWE